MRRGVGDAGGLEKRRRQHGHRDVRNRGDSDWLDLEPARALAVRREQTLVLDVVGFEEMVNEVRRLLDEERHEQAAQEQAHRTARRSAHGYFGYHSVIRNTRSPENSQAESAAVVL